MVKFSKKICKFIMQTVRNILNTVTTAATAMGAVENFGDTTNGHLGQILAEFGVTPDGISTTPSTNTDGSSSGGGGAVTTGPFGWIFTPSRIGGFEFFIRTFSACIFVFDISTTTSIYFYQFSVSRVWPNIIHRCYGHPTYGDTRNLP